MNRKKKTFCIMILLTLFLTMIGTPNVALAKTSTLKFITKANYDAIGGFSEGLAWVKKGDNYYYINKAGKVIIDLSKKKYRKNNRKIASVEDFHDGVALIKFDDEYYYDEDNYFIDKKGKIVLDIDIINKHRKKDDYEIFSVTSTYSDGVFALCSLPMDCIEATYDLKGELKIHKFPSTGFWWYTEGLMPQLYYNRKKDQNKWGFVDKNFKFKIPAKYDDARPFNQGLAPVKVGDVWGFINKKGKMVIKPQYEDFCVVDYEHSYKIFNHGIACVKKNGKWGAIDDNGKTVIAFKYPNHFSIEDGYAIIQKNDKYSYITLDGKTMLKSKYDDANTFTKDGVALVAKDGAYYLIQKNGKKVSEKTWKFESSYVSLNDPDIVWYKKNGKWGFAIIK